MTKYLGEKWVANGSGILLRRSRTNRTKAVGGGGDPLVPEGYTLLKKFNLTVDEGWFKYTGHVNSKAYFTPSNVSFGPTGMRIRCTHEPTGDSQWSSGEAAWANGKPGQPNGFIPQNAFYIRFVAKMEQPPILGDHTAFLWSRTITGAGKGEYDYHELFANHMPGIGTLTSYKSNKVTLIETPYVDGNLNYSREYNYSVMYPGLTTNQAKVQMCQDPHVYEVYKYPTKMETYVDGHLQTTHVRGGAADGGTMTNALWDANFNSGELLDLRVSYEYGDWLKSEGADRDHVGNAGPPQPFSGNRYLNLSELLVAVPS